VKTQVKRLGGFTLIELAVAIFVITLLLGSLLVPLTTQVEQKQISDTQKTLDDIKEALLGFALVYGYLPCPDATSGAGANDGLEDVDSATGICNGISGSSPNKFAAGNLPWATLDAANADAWGNRFYYVVLDGFSRRSPATPFSLTTSGGLRVCDTAACTTTLSTTAVAIILSYGKNGYGAISASTGSVNPAPTSADELENTDTDRDVVSRVSSTLGATSGEFDDIVTWLSKYMLFNRMVGASKLP